MPPKGITPNPYSRIDKSSFTNELSIRLYISSPLL